MTLSKDGLIFSLVGMIVGILIGVFLVGSSVSRPAVTAAQAPVVPSDAPSEEALPEGHPPIDEATLTQRITEQEEILKKDPENQQAILALGNLNFNLKNYKDAVKWYEKAIVKDPDNPNLISDLGTAHLWNNETDLAFELYQKALGIDPKHFQTLMNLGVGRMMKGDRKGAAEAWEKVLEYHPTHQEAAMIRDAVQRLRSETPPNQTPTP